MRARANLRHQTQSNASGWNVLAAGSQSSDRLFYQSDFINRVNVDGIDAGANCLINLRIALAGAIEDDLTGAKADAQCFEKLAAAVHFNINAGFEHGPQHRHVRVCFRGIAKLYRTVDSVRGALQSIDVRADARLRKDKKRRIK